MLEGELNGAGERRPLSLGDVIDVPEWPVGRGAGDRWKVLLVDEEPGVHSVTELVLSDFAFEGRGLEFLHAYSGAEAMAAFERHPDIAVALVDIEDAGLWLVRRVRDELGNRFVRLILRTGQPGGAPEREVIAQYDIDDYRAKTELWSLKLTSTLMTALRSYRDIVGQDEWRRGSEQVRDAVIMTMATLAEARDNEGHSHIRRIQHGVDALARSLQGDPRFPELRTEGYIELLFLSASLHDLGKLCLPDRILLNTGHWTPEEFEIMKKHTTLGGETIRAAARQIGYDCAFLAMACDIAESHHEKWDGTGYPEGLREENIPLSARLVAVVDAYDALMARSMYPWPLAHIEAIAAIVDKGGHDFDPDIAAAFQCIEGEIAGIMQRYADGRA